MSTRPGPRRLASLAVALLIAPVLALVAPSPALGHSSQIGSSPDAGAVLDAPPESVVVEFDSALLDVGTAIVVRDANGASITTSAPLVERTSISVEVDPRVPAGEYTVAYRVASVDGHTIESSFTYTVARSDHSAEAVPSAGVAASPARSDHSAEAVPPAGVAASPARSDHSAEGSGSGPGWLPVAAAVGVLVALTLGVAGAIALRR